MSSVFTKIINGELPCYNIYEDEWTIAILSIDPIKLGHTIVIPKVEVDHFFDVPEPYYEKVFANSKLMAQAIKKATGCARVGTMIQGFEVAHFHHHLVPVDKPSDLDFKHAHREPQENMEAIFAKIKQHMDEA